MFRKNYIILPSDNPKYWFEIYNKNGLFLFYSVKTNYN